MLANGYACKDPKQVTAEDFYTSGFDIKQNTTDGGSGSNSISVVQIPGINTLDISIGRLDLEPYGVLPPHYHPRATEILTVLQGTIEVGFVTSNPEYRLISKVIKKGDVFVIPKGLVHFQKNVGNDHGVAIVAFNSQDRGVVTVGDAVFGSNPRVSTGLLAKSFKVEDNVISLLKTKF